MQTRCQQPRDMARRVIQIAKRACLDRTHIDARWIFSAREPMRAECTFFHRGRAMHERIVTGWKGQSEMRLLIGKDPHARKRTDHHARATANAQTWVLCNHAVFDAATRGSRWTNIDARSLDAMLARQR